MKISVYAVNKPLKEKVEEDIRNLELTGYEGTDRILISDYLDGVKGKVSVLYDGNTVYPLKKYLNGLLRMKKTGRLDLTDDMYHFLSQNFDIAHYDKAGFEAAYDNSWEKWYRSQHREFDRIPAWHTDLKRIVNDFRKGSEPKEQDKKDAIATHDTVTTASKKFIKRKAAIYDGQMTLSSFMAAS